MHIEKRRPAAVGATPNMASRTPIPIGPLPSDVSTSGQAECFHLLDVGLIERGINPQVIDIAAEDGEWLKSLRRVLKYMGIMARVARACMRQRRAVYITIAQSWSGFVLDMFVIVIARVTKHGIVCHLHRGNYEAFFAKCNPVLSSS